MSVQFDLKQVPFSRYGSYLAFSDYRRGDQPELTLRTVQGDATGSRQLFSITLISDGLPIPYRLDVSPSVLRLTSTAGYAEFCFDGATCIRLRGVGVGVRLAQGSGEGVDTRGERFDYAYSADGDQWDIISFSCRLKTRLFARRGRLVVDAPWQITRCEHVQCDFVPGDDGAFEGVLDTYIAAYEPRRYAESFDACAADALAEYQHWLDGTLPVPPEYADAAALAAYITWSAVVAPRGHLTRPAMLMSKNWMCHVWSWDHCFNALALARHNPVLAWDQLMLFADKQDAQGAFPDFIDDAGIIWAFCKPPIHGWAVGEILKRTEAITRDQIAALYPALCRWTEWWLNYRDEDADGIPQYNHGNDSGWDNATIFDAGLPVEAPDLPAYLILQMDVLSDLAVRLGRMADAALWRDRAAVMLKRLLAHSWNGEQFVSLRSNSHAANPSGDSLINYMPVVLGRRLPPEMQTRLVNGIRRFVTAHGLATEHPQSPHYTADGYWRGPIWAPSTMLAVYGLAELGADDLVRDISRKFCNIAARSGMAENYDALTGDGLRDRAYTWTASVFFLLASGYLY